MFRDNGYVEHGGWTRRGLITRWDVIDRRTVLLRIERGRTRDLCALLVFDEEISSYDGFNYHGGARLKASAQLHIEGEERNQQANAEVPISHRTASGTKSLANGLVAFYPFNGNANDESGNGHHANVNGATLSIDRNGNSAAAYSFDGNDWIVSDTLALRSITALSVCAWIKATNSAPSYDGYAVVSGSGVIYMSRKSRSPASPQLGCIMAALDGSSIDNQDDDFARMPVNDGTWHFIAAVNDGATTHVYVDGQLGDTYLENVGSTFSGITVGRIASGRAYWVGAIDDVRVYSRALSLAEIQALGELDH